MIVIEWIAMVLVLLSFACFSKGHMKRGFSVSLVACIAWTVVSIDTSLWGLLVLQVGIAFFNILGLWRLRK